MRDPGFDWTDLRHFLAVARTGKLTEAGRRLGVEHSTVGRRIAALEAALGARLFDRLPSGYVLTAPGERLLLSAEAMEALALTAQSDLSDADLSVSGQVRIGAPDGFGAMFLAPRLGRLAAAHPDLDVQLVVLPRIFSLSKREADIAIALSRPEEGRLHVRKLTDYDLRVYAAPNYLAGHPPITSRADLNNHRLIGYIEDLIFTRELDYQSLVCERARSGLRSSNLIAQHMATRAGAGLCVLPDFLASGDMGLMPVLPDEIRLTRSFWLLTHADTRHLARIRATADFIVEQVQAARGVFQAG